MKVLMVALDLNPPWVEGIRNTTFALSTGLLNKGHRVHFLTKGYRGQPQTEQLQSGIVVHRIMTGESSGYIMGFQNFLFWLTKAVIEIAKKHEIDVIHAHSSYPVFGWGVGMTSLLTRVRRVFSLYSCSTLPPSFEYSSLVRHGLRIAKSRRILMLGGAGSIIVHSQTSFDSLIQSGFSRDAIRIVPVGIDTQRFRPKRVDKKRIDNELKIPDDARIALFGGDMTPYKGVEFFLRSLAHLENKDKRIVGLVLSKGLYEKESSRMQSIWQLEKRLNVTENIRMLGIRDDIDSIYNRADLVVFPFLEDYTLMDTPRALLEAMACGKPVIATDVGAMAEIVQNGERGLVIRPNSELALTRAIAYLLENREIASNMGTRAAAFIKESHGLDQMVSAVERIYEEAR